MIRQEQQWGLSQVHGVTSCAAPAYIQSGISSVRNVRWPAALGKGGAVTRKKKQYAKYPLVHRDAIPGLKRLLVEPLVKKGEEGIQDVLQTMKDYKLTPADRIAILGKTTKTGINPKVKRAFTLACKNESFAFM
jgi:hypothetical protein